MQYNLAIDCLGAALQAAMSGKPNTAAAYLARAAASPDALRGLTVLEHNGKLGAEAAQRKISAAAKRAQARRLVAEAEAEEKGEEPTEVEAGDEGEEEEPTEAGDEGDEGGEEEPTEVEAGDEGDEGGEFIPEEEGEDAVPVEAFRAVAAHRKAAPKKATASPKKPVPTMAKAAAAAAPTMASRIAAALKKQSV